MSKTIFAFRTKEKNSKSLYWVLHIFLYHNLKAELIDFKEGEYFVSAGGKELNEALKKTERQTKTFRIVKNRS